MANSFVTRGSGGGGNAAPFDMASYVPIEFPKWVYPEGREPFIVQNREEELAALSVDKPKEEKAESPLPVKAKRSK